MYILLLFANFILSFPLINDRLPSAVAGLIKGASLCKSCDVSDGIVVVGAGVSGLAAINTLKWLISQSAKKCCKVSVLEANPDRIGGRVFSYNAQHHLNFNQFQKSANENPEILRGLEVGAGWIHDIKNNPIFELASMLKLKIKKVGGDMSYIGGRYVQLFDQDTGKELSYATKLYSLFLMAKLRNELHRETEFRKKYNMHDLSIAEYLPKAFKNLNFSDRDKKLVRWHIDVIFGGDSATRLQSASLFDSDDAGALHWNTGGDAVISNGYYQIIDALARDIDITLDSQIASVKYSANSANSGILMTSRKGEVFKAKKAIFTVPLSMYKPETPTAILFYPSLSLSRQAAYDNYEMGVLNRIVLKYDKPFWNTRQYTFGWIPLSADFKFKNRTFSSENFIWSMAVNPLAEKRPVDSGVLEFMVGGDMWYEILEHSKVEIIEMLHLLLIKSFKPKYIPSFPEYAFSDWLNYPYSFESYAHRKPQFDINTKQFNDPEEDKQTLRRPISDLIYFAGEHLADDEDGGTVHGAYKSGVHSARQLVADILCRVSCDTENIYKWADLK